MLQSGFAYHLRCLEEDATNPELSQLDRLALVRDRARRIREIEAELTRAEVSGVRPGSLSGVHQFP